MQNHSKMPWKRGRRPTLFSVSRVSEAPMKKRESVIKCFAKELIPPPTVLRALVAVVPIKSALLKR